MIPQFLNRFLERDYGKVLAEEILRGYSVRRPVTLRVNTLKTDGQRVVSALAEVGIGVRRVSWYDHALIADGADEETLRRLSLYKKGEIYLQSLSSMLSPLVLDPQSGENILDMTAAPGGKTTQLYALSHGGAQITACEKDKIRFERLKFNVQRQGASRVNLLLADATKLDDFFRFDKILLDAPCSGSGTLDPSRPIALSQKLIENSAQLQKKLLKKALTLLKRGGLLVYSTCSVLNCENGDVLREVLDSSDGELIPIPEERFSLPRLPSPKGTLCVAPTELYEGFFVAHIRKK